MKPSNRFSISLLLGFLLSLFLFPGAVQLEPKNKVWENRCDGIDFGGITSIALHPDNNAVMIVGSKIKGLYLSTNYTKRWKSILIEKFDKLWINCIAIHPVQRDRILIGTQSGLFVSDDFGSSWHERKFGTSVMQVYSIAFHPTEVNTLFIGTFEGGIIKSEDNGSHWTYLYKGNPNLDTRVTSIQFNPNNPVMVIASLYGKGILVSDNGGESWSPSNNGLYDLNILTMKMDPLHPSVLYAGTLGGIFKSSNGGKDWIPCNIGLTAVWKEIYSLVIHPSHTNELYAGSINGTVYYSKDYAQTWEQLPLIKSNEKNDSVWIYSLVLDPLHPRMLYAGTNVGMFRFRNSNASMTDSLILELESPHQNDILRDTEVVFRGKASDNEFGIDKVIINQQPVFLEPDGAFEHRMPLHDGKNLFSLSAFNHDGFSISRQLEVFGVADDSEPLLCLYYPKEETVQQVSTNCIALNGQAFDAESGIDRVTINQVTVPVNSKGEFVKMLFLNRGLNVVEIKATNCAGISTTCTRSFYFDFR